MKLVVSKIYLILLSRGLQKSDVVEKYFEVSADAKASEDDIRNERIYFLELFSEINNSYFEELLSTLKRELSKISMENANSHFELLGFIQIVGATAMWKHGLPIGSALKDFVRDFDRLDTIEERNRLFNSCRETV